MRTRIIVAAGLAGAGLAVAGSSFAHVYGGSHDAATPKPPQAKPPQTFYLSPTGSDANPCTSAAACQTFQRAFQAAHPGDIVQLQSGDYPDQTISGVDPGKPVVFEPAPAAQVTVGWLAVHATNLEIRNLVMAGWQAYPESTGFTARNIQAHNFEIWGSQGTRVIGGSYGPSYNPGGNTLVNYIAYGGTDANPVAPKNILIDGAYLHDVRRGGPANHNECIFVSGGDGITIRDSRFQRCDVFDIFFTMSPYGTAPTNIVVENNFFDQGTLDGSYDNCCTYYAIRFTDQIPLLKNVSIRYNSARQTLNVGTTNNVNVSMIANVAPRQQSECGSGITYAYNVWDNAKCGRTDHRAALGFVDPANLDLHLKPGSRAIKGGDPKLFPKRDIDGHLRPKGKRPDAGAAQSP
jgi:hypothetical protein